jgi:hypothetical protein
MVMNLYQVIFLSVLCLTAATALVSGDEQGVKVIKLLFFTIDSAAIKARVFAPLEKV